MKNSKQWLNMSNIGFFVKANMALNATWKFKKAQNFEEYVEKK